MRSLRLVLFSIATGVVGLKQAAHISEAAWFKKDKEKEKKPKKEAPEFVKFLSNVGERASDGIKAVGGALQKGRERNLEKRTENKIQDMHREAEARRKKIIEKADATLKKKQETEEAEAAAGKSKEKLKEAQKQRAEEKKHIKELKAEQKKVRYGETHYIKASPGEECPESWEPIMDKENCRIAQLVFGDDERATITVEMMLRRPTGCFFDYKAGIALFNLDAVGALTATDERICEKKRPARGEVDDLHAIAKKAEATLDIEENRQQQELVLAREVGELGEGALSEHKYQPSTAEDFDLVPIRHRGRKETQFDSEAEETLKPLSQEEALRAVQGFGDEPAAQKTPKRKPHGLSKTQMMILGIDSGDDAEMTTTPLFKLTTTPGPWSPKESEAMTALSATGDKVTVSDESSKAVTSSGVSLEILSAADLEKKYKDLKAWKGKR